jgi:hypothetical protein
MDRRNIPPARFQPATWHSAGEGSGASEPPDTAVRPAAWYVGPAHRATRPSGSAARSGRTRAPLLPALPTSLDTSDGMSAATRHRLGESPGPDWGAPPAAPLDVAQRYADPRALPEPVYAGRGYLAYGRVTVKEADRELHEQARTRMACTPHQRQHLIHLEQGGGPHVRVDYVRIHDDAGHAPADALLAQTSVDQQNRVVVCRVPRDVAYLQKRGGLNPAVSAACHELMHAARMFVGYDSIQAHLQGAQPAGAMLTQEEWQVICRGDNVQAMTFGEGLRDSYGQAGHYQAAGFDSPEPANAWARATIQHFQPQLWAASVALDAAGAGLQNPASSADGARLNEDRDQLANRSFAALRHLGQDPQGSS